MWTFISVNGAKFSYASWGCKDLRNSTCFAESSSWLKIFWHKVSGKNSDRGAVKNISMESITHFIFWKVHLVTPKLPHRFLESVYMIEYHYSHGKTALMILRLHRVLLNIWDNRMSLSLGIWFFLIPTSITKNELWQSSFEDEQILQGTYYTTNSLILKSCQMNMLPFMDLKCILNPQHHITISLR